MKNWERKWKTGSQNEKLGAKMKMYINWDPKMENWERKWKTGFRKWKNLPMIILIIIIFGVDLLSWPFLTFAGPILTFGGIFWYCRCIVEAEIFPTKCWYLHMFGPDHRVIEHLLFHCRIVWRIQKRFRKWMDGSWTFHFYLRES